MARKPLLARCREATKNANASQLLYRIAFWSKYAKIIHDGKTWSANSSAQWCEETELSHDQYRRAIALLRALSLVETSQHLFGRKNITHVRLTEKGKEIIAAPPNESDIALPVGCTKAHPAASENAQLYILGESYMEDQHGESNIAFANAHATGDTSKNKFSGENDKEKGITHKKLIAEYEDSVIGLSEIWHDLINEVEGDYVPPFSSKHLGQM